MKKEIPRWNRIVKGLQAIGKYEPNMQLGFDDGCLCAGDAESESKQHEEGDGLYGFEIDMEDGEYTKEDKQILKDNGWFIDDLRWIAWCIPLDEEL